MQSSISRRTSRCQSGIPNPNAPDALMVMDGQELVGKILHRDGSYFAFDARGILQGEYRTQGQAMRVLPHFATRSRRRGLA
jgi:hypothetical protein